jgi:hypothetical protein
MDDAELSRLIDESVPAPPASAEDLAAILARHGRRWRVIAAGTVLAVAVITTVVVARSPGPAAQHVQAPVALGAAQLAEAVATQPSPSAAGPSPAPPISFERLFLRTTAGGVTMRVYLGTLYGPLECGPGQACPSPHCLPHTLVHVGLSTDAAVGELAVPADGPAPPVMALVGATGFGLPGVSSNFALVVRAGAPVATVRMRFANGDTDEMAPVRGWAVLAHDGASPFGTLEAVGADGRVIASTAVPPPTLGSPPAGGGPPATSPAACAGRGQAA